MKSDRVAAVDQRDFRLDRAMADDLGFVMATERRPGFDQLVGRWEKNRHQAALTDGRHAYFIGRIAGAPVAFAILRDWCSPEKVTQIKRIAVAAPGHGHGRSMLTALIDAVFDQTDAHRLHLGVFPENARARRAYEAVGFAAEGVARGSAFFGGQHRDELIMAMLRPEWTARRAAMTTP